MTQATEAFVNSDQQLASFHENDFCRQARELFTENKNRLLVQSKE